MHCRVLPRKLGTMRLGPDPHHIELPEKPSDSCEFYPCTLGTSKACHPKVQGVFLNLRVSEDDSKAKMKVSPDYYLFIQGIFDDSANFTPEQIVQP